MGVSLSTARWLAPTSFIIDFVAQQYGMLSTPNMKDIHDANLSFFSPQPFFIGGFFFPQQLFQLAWLYRLWKAGSRNQPSSSTGAGVGQEEQEGPQLSATTRTMVDFTPFYTIGNLCIATWMVFWNASDLRTSNVFVVINSLAQLYYVFARLPPLDTSSTDSILTHIVSKTFAGIGVLDLLHNGSVAYFPHQMQPPMGVLGKVLTGLGFAGLAAGSDWILGGCLVYDLVALAVGQGRYYGNEGGWGSLLGWYAVGTAGIVVLKNVLRPPYVSNAKHEYRVLGKNTK